MTKESMVLFPRLTFYKGAGVLNQARIPVVLPGVMEDAQR